MATTQVEKKQTEVTIKMKLTEELWNRYIFASRAAGYKREGDWLSYFVDQHLDYLFNDDPHMLQRFMAGPDGK